MGRVNASQRLPPAPVRLWRWAVLAVVVAAQVAFLFYRSKREEERFAEEKAKFGETNPPADHLGERAPAHPGEFVVSRGKAHVVGLATDGARVYFGESLGGLGIVAVPVTGGAESTLGSAELPIAVALGKDVLVVADMGGLTAAEGNTITAFPLDGSGAPRVLASKVVLPIAVAVSATHAYWVDGGNVDRDNIDGFVARAPLAGGAHTVLAAGERQPSGIAVDATHVYWARHDKTGHGEVVRMPVDGGPIEVVSPGQDRVKRITIVGSDVYWISWNDLSGTRAAVRKAPVRGGPALDVAVAETRMCSMVLDGEAVYWSEPGEVIGTEPSTSGRILKKALHGGEPVVLASGQDRPCHVAVDATHVYFSTQSLERVKRTPKTPASASP